MAQGFGYYGVILTTTELLQMKDLCGGNAGLSRYITHSSSSLGLLAVS